MSVKGKKELLIKSLDLFVGKEFSGYVWKMLRSLQEFGAREEGSWE